MNEPVDVGPLGLTVKDRVDDLVLDLLGIVGTGEINQVCGILGHGQVVAQLLDLWNIMFQSHKFNIPVLDLSCPEPVIHDQEQEPSYDNGHITAVRELFHISKKEAELYGKINNKV